ncbi:MAG TPA: GAP family protein [Actinomycetota bacterium]|nr:GAP family protein [Actinomycetota bacterium]
MTSFLTILPLAIVMVAGPQIISAFLLATSERARRNSVAYVAGAALASAVSVTLFFLVADIFNLSRGDQKDSGAGVVDYLLIALLLILMVRVFLKRHETEPPKWMGRLGTASPGFSFRLGFLLFLLMPTDIITSATVGTFLAGSGAPLWHALPFLLLTTLLVAIPLLILLLMGRRANTILPKAREWMSANSWVVSEIVLVFFLVITLAGLG